MEDREDTRPSDRFRQVVRLRHPKRPAFAHILAPDPTCHVRPTIHHEPRRPRHRSRSRSMCQLRQGKERRRQAEELHGCFLVKYCSVDCQKAHRKKHKKACKERVAELKDEKLYGQGHERPLEDFCPICTLPIALPMESNSGFMVCCTTKVCAGCGLAAHKRGMLGKCPFCRTPSRDIMKSTLAMVQKRMKANDPQAFRFLASTHYFGTYGSAKDVPRAIELWREAAKLGSLEAHLMLGDQYMRGEAVAKDEAKAVEYWEVAAMQGHVESRHNLGIYESNNRNNERAVRHLMISAKMGYKESLDTIKEMFADGHALKQQYAEALAGYQIAVEETKSPDRDEYRQGNFKKSVY